MIPPGGQSKPTRVRPPGLGNRFAERFPGLGGRVENYHTKMFVVPLFFRFRDFSQPVVCVRALLVRAAAAVFGFGGGHLVSVRR